MAKKYICDFNNNSDLQTSQSIDSKIAKPIALISEGSIISAGTNVIVTGWGVLTVSTIKMLIFTQGANNL